MLKAIPTILKIEENTKLIPQIAKNTDLIPQMADNTEKIFNNTEKILEEVKGLREDQPEFTLQFRQLQADVRAIKEHLGMI